MNAFPARHNGRCGACDERINEDDLIRFDAHSATNFVHANCSDHEPPEMRENPVCQTCWLTHPEGACDR